MSTRDHGSFPPPQAAVAPPPSHTGHSTASAYQNPSAINNNGGGGGKVGGGSAVGDDQYLAKAGEFNITQEDRQEGYDPALALLAPRVQQPEVERATSPPPVDPTTGLPLATPGEQRRVGLPASSMPYTSRDQSNSLEKTGGKSSRRQSGTEGTKSGQRVAGGARRRSRKKKLAWYKTPKGLILIMLLVLAIALGVGLGVGLSVGKNKSSSSSGQGSSGPSPTVVIPTVSNTRPDVTISETNSQGDSAATATDNGRTGQPTISLIPNVPSQSNTSAFAVRRRRY